MGDPIRNNPARTPPATNTAAEAPLSAATQNSASEPSPETSLPEPHERADQAAADLDALSAARRLRPRRRRRPAAEARPDLTPERVAGRFMELETRRAPFQEADVRRFFDAMEPAEQTEFLEQLAGKVADVAVGHLQGLVETFNDVRDHFNEKRLALGEAELPAVNLNSGSMRALLQNGIRHGLEGGIHKVLELALHAVFGEPSRLPHADDPASAFAPLPDLEHPNVDGFNVRWSQPF